MRYTPSEEEPITYERLNIHATVASLIARIIVKGFFLSESLRIELREMVSNSVEYEV